MVPLLLPLAALAAKPADPLRSPSWDAMVERHLDGGAYVFDARVQLQMPASAEDPLSVPVEVRVRDLEHRVFGQQFHQPRGVVVAHHPVPGV